MSDVKTIFLVSRGSYSDYNIESVWSTLEAAEAERDRLKATRRYDPPYIEEMFLDKRNDEPVLLWRAYLMDDADGRIEVDDKPIESLYPETARRIGRREPPYGTVGWQAWGLSPDLARKNLTDAIAKAKAQALE